MTLTVGSLFAGIGGFDLGLERTGHYRTIWFCESDPYCQRVLAKHWPSVPCHPDVRVLDATRVVRPDVLCGGFPCQDISVAGTGKGLDGARSGLWHEFARLIGELRPSYVLVENVPAILARGAVRIVADLATVGYDAEWDCLPAAAFGAPHRRDRFWLVAYPNGRRVRDVAERDQRQGWQSRAAVGGDSQPVDDGAARPDPDANGRRRDGQLDDAAMADADGTRLQRHRGSPVRSRERPAPESRPESRTRQAVADTTTGNERNAGRRQRVLDVPQDTVATDGASSSARPVPAGRGDRARDPQGAGSRDLRAEWWLVEPDVGRLAYGVPHRVDRLRALGNALVPQIAEWIGNQIIGSEDQ